LGHTSVSSFVPGFIFATTWTSVFSIRSSTSLRLSAHMSWIGQPSNINRLYQIISAQRY
jgi:hypothetical protein